LLSSPSNPHDNHHLPLTKEIKAPHDLNVFQTSDTYNAFLGFILALNESVIGKPLSFPCHVSTVLQSILDVIHTMNNWVDEIPPKPHRTRFGNDSFCEFYDKFQANSVQLAEKILPEETYNELITRNRTEDNTVCTYKEVISEVAAYLSQSIGDRTRIDHGSGHEAHFVAFLYVLDKIGVIREDDYCAVILRVFSSYITFMRKLQEIYWLEPAGSHGVWGLDDYQFLPFLWGAAQLIEHKYIRPKSVRSKDVVNTYAHEYMYLGCIQFITKVKTGTLVEHSPMLVDISGVKMWKKVNEGMIKMYKAELLGKFPVMQHFLFGKFLPFKSTASDEDLRNNDDECDGHHAHNHTGTHTLPNCCVSRIPSAFSNRPQNPRNVFTPFD